jgi:hypothetical protein
MEGFLDPVNKLRRPAKIATSNIGRNLLECFGFRIKRVLDNGFLCFYASWDSDLAQGGSPRSLGDSLGLAGKRREQAWKRDSS